MMAPKAFVAIVLLFIPLYLSAQYIEVGPYSGAVSDSSAVIVYKLSLPDQACRVEYGKDSLFRKTQFSDQYTSSGTQANYLKVALSKLEPGTKYFYRLELNAPPCQGAGVSFAPSQTVPNPSLSHLVIP